MLDPIELVTTIYLGDRALKAITINGWLKTVALQIDVISRLRPGTIAWNFYTGEDISDGVIVLTGVKSIRFAPPGYVPNDFISSLNVKQIESPTSSSDGIPLFRFEMNVASVEPDGSSHQVIVEVDAEGMYLEDPSRPGLEIRE